MSHAIERLNPSTLPNAAEIGYSQISIVEPGRMAFISGQVAISPDGAPIPDDVAEQMKLAAKNARAALEAVGATFADVAMARIYMVDLTPERLEEAMPEFLAAFNGVQPSLTGVGVAALAAPGLQVEMELTVRLPG
ncbi:RidA family protein [Nisaea sediminum]|uniref:RidA family protein n=1 Tax=Nisaea sediminum TaxID=2775867 RepID=UPI001868EA22|nr:RidA family protein [Nisaea sediminum]